MYIQQSEVIDTMYVLTLSTYKNGWSNLWIEGEIDRMQRRGKTSYIRRSHSPFRLSHLTNTRNSKLPYDSQFNPILQHRRGGKGRGDMATVEPSQKEKEIKRHMRKHAYQEEIRISANPTVPPARVWPQMSYAHPVLSGDNPFSFWRQWPLCLVKTIEPMDLNGLSRKNSW